MRTLSKSDFKLAGTCPQKLLYKKAGFEMNNQGSEFLQILAEGGYLVGKMAKVMYEEMARREGYACAEISTGRDHQEAVRQTDELLERHDRIILFEPAIRSGQKLIRVDILIKDGNVFSLIEVKAKSHESDADQETEQEQKKELKEYMEDVAYQQLVLQEYLQNHAEMFPNAIIQAGLLMPDRKAVTSIDNLAAWFSLTRDEQLFEKVQVDFLETGRAGELWENGQPMLKVLYVDKEIAAMMPEIQSRVAQYLSYLNGQSEPDIEQDCISTKCFACEFRNPHLPEQDGYAMCLGQRAYAEHHISELYHAATVGGRSPLVNDLLRKNEPLTIFSFAEEDFLKKDGSWGSRGIRQRIQYHNTRANQEYFSDDMADALAASFKYPLHFIDFETLTPAVPHHRGMSPYETIAFQWSCHTIASPGSAPVHSEWINVGLDFPNFKFAETLMQQLGDEGTPLMWATHENTVLRAILRQLQNAERYQPGYSNPLLEEWLTRMTKEKSGNKKTVIREGRLLDMNKFTLEHYFHPYMKGKTSIKKTLPAVWNHQPYLYEVPYFAPYYRRDDAGEVLNPYETLQYMREIDGEAYMDAENMETVKEGSGAMRAYQDMLFGAGRHNQERRETLRQELLNYCKLDTMAMVIIWHHWKTSLGVS